VIHLANVLSQQEIDNLLKALTSGEVSLTEEEEKPVSKIKKYDFRLANKFTKEQMKSLHTIFENYTRLLTNYFTGTLRVACEVEMVSIEEQKYFEFTNSLPTVEFFGIIGMSPLIGSALIDISPQITAAIINRVLGGSVEYDNAIPNFTEIELVIMEKILRQMLALLDEAWYRIVPIDSSLERIEINPQFAQIVSANETIAIITMNVKIRELEGFIHFCLPHMAIKPIEKQLTTRYLYNIKQEGKEGEESAREIGDLIKKTQLNLIARLKTTYSTVQDCLNLQVGDVLMLDHHVDTPIDLYVEHIPKFKGQLGLKGNKVAIKITDIDYKEDNQDEWDLISRRN